MNLGLELDRETHPNIRYFWSAGGNSRVLNDRRVSQMFLPNFRVNGCEIIPVGSLGLVLPMEVSWILKLVEVHV